MKCPICNVDLQMTERQGVEIDYCPQCRGVWLDRGELDKILERSEPRETQWDEPSHGGRRTSHEHEEHRRYKKKSIWRELFDF